MWLIASAAETTFLPSPLANGHRTRIEEEIGTLQEEEALAVSRPVQSLIGQQCLYSFIYLKHTDSTCKSNKTGYV